MTGTDNGGGGDVVETFVELYPDTTVSDQWVAVQFHERGPVLVLHEDGTVTERSTMPAANQVAQLPLGGAA